MACCVAGLIIYDLRRHGHGYINRPQASLGFATAGDSVLRNNGGVFSQVNSIARLLVKESGGGRVFISKNVCNIMKNHTLYSFSLQLERLAFQLLSTPL